ncbi:MAG: Dabb family protein [Mariprofundaceae bacterium]
MRIRRFILLLFILLAAGVFSACTVEQTATGQVEHVVICWLQEPGNPDARRKVIEATQSLKDIPGVLDIRTGSVLSSERSIVDDSFDIGIVITFANEQAMRAYITHPKHKNVVENIIRPVVRKIVVYDFTDG